MKTGMKRCAAVVAATIGLGAFGGVLQSNLFTESFWASSPLKENDVSTRPVAEIASDNLALLESGGVLASMGRGPTGPQARDERPVALVPPPASQPVVSGAPNGTAMLGKPPEGSMEAADAVRRLEQLHDGAFVGSDEYTRERKAIERAMQPKPMAPKEGIMVASTVKAATQVSPAKAEGKARALLPAVHLASYRSRKAADRGWIQLRRAHREVLDNLESEITKVNLGPRKGIFYRLKAGPVADKAAAAEVCRKLKSRRQYCEASFMDGG